MISLSSDRVEKPNENLINYIQNWLILGRQLISEQEQMNFNSISDNDHLLSQLKVSLD